MDEIFKRLDHKASRRPPAKAVAASIDLDSPCPRKDIIECNVCYVFYHMIQETARHAGHADIIRETLDGTSGI